MQLTLLHKEPILLWFIVTHPLRCLHCRTCACSSYRTQKQMYWNHSLLKNAYVTLCGGWGQMSTSASGHLSSAINVVLFLTCIAETKNMLKTKFHVCFMVNSQDMDVCPKRTYGSILYQILMESVAPGPFHLITATFWQNDLDATIGVLGHFEDPQKRDQTHAARTAIYIWENIQDQSPRMWGRALEWQ